MSKKLLENKEEIVNKKETLEKARKQLKTEFMGLNDIIDELISIVSSWYIFPYIQEKPVVINLWGLTGTGKTSLVNRMVDILGFSDKHFKFDMGSQIANRYGIGEVLEEIDENINGTPVVITLDEFQHARSINENGEEVDKSNIRLIWQMLDTGKFETSRNLSNLDEMYNSLVFYRYVLKLGVVVQNGKVVKNPDLFLNKCATDRYHRSLTPKTKKGEKTNFVSDEIADYAFETAKEKFIHLSEVRDKLNRMNGFETIQFIEEVLDHGVSTRTIDSSKAIIFIMGNLDEAYSMGSNYTPDISADEFHEQTKKINITHIKNALKKRFRNEQISRLGNTHIIYPAFNKEVFQRIIEIELQKIKKKLNENFDLNVEFEDSIKQLIYSEGVFPTQGARPLFATIQQVINTRLGKVASELILNNLTANRIIFSYSKSFIQVRYYSGTKLIHTFKEKQQLNLEKLRKCKKDDLQAIIAVHESGHAILTALLMKTIPEAVISSTVDNEASGFVFSKLKWDYVSKKEIYARIAVYLGGFIAEEIIFGKDNVTMGSEEDIYRATSFVTTLLKSSGMGGRLASFRVKDFNSSFSIFDLDDEINGEALRWLEAGKELAEKTLKANKALLLEMSNYLSDNRLMEKEQIKEIVLKHANSLTEDELIENADHLFYRKRLKESVKEIRYSEKSPKRNAVEFSLNKNKRTAS